MKSLNERLWSEVIEFSNTCYCDYCDCHCDGHGCDCNCDCVDWGTE